MSSSAAQNFYLPLVVDASQFPNFDASNDEIYGLQVKNKGISVIVDQANQHSLQLKNTAVDVDGKAAGYALHVQQGMVNLEQGARVGGTLKADGVLQVSNDAADALLYANTMNADNAAVTGALNVQNAGGDATLNSDIIVASSVTVNSSLTMAPNSAMSFINKNSTDANISLSNIYVNPDDATDLGLALDVSSGRVNIAQRLDVGEKLIVSGVMEIQNDGRMEAISYLDQQATATLGNTYIAQDGSKGVALLIDAGTLQVNQKVNTDEIIANTGAITALSGSTATFISTLNADGAVTFGDTLSVAASSDFGGNMSVHNIASTAILTADNISVSDTLLVTGAATLSDDLSVSGAASFASTMSVSGTSLFQSNITLHSDSGNASLIADKAEISTTLSVGGASTFASDVTIHNADAPVMLTADKATFNGDVVVAQEGKLSIERSAAGSADATAVISNAYTDGVALSVPSGSVDIAGTITANYAHFQSLEIDQTLDLGQHISIDIELGKISAEGGFEVRSADPLNPDFVVDADGKVISKDTAILASAAECVPLAIKNSDGSATMMSVDSAGKIQAYNTQIQAYETAGDALLVKHWDQTLPVEQQKVFTVDPVGYMHAKTTSISPVVADEYALTVAGKSKFDTRISRPCAEEYSFMKTLSEYSSNDLAELFHIEFNNADKSNFFVSVEVLCKTDDQLDPVTGAVISEGSLEYQTASFAMRGRALKPLEDPALVTAVSVTSNNTLGSGSLDASKPFAFANHQEEANQFKFMVRPLADGSARLFAVSLKIQHYFNSAAQLPSVVF